ncbi:uncharacterized protein LOC122372590 [Amphibalanus amphitrite]|uniref:uncharacterized protein LOC122369109 n=1 Tax=Amphibalanus amphitrite TaxID=1232801 RepID=UPI001C8FD06A|nr:uncharacterized protein LOC122369109 [Amphibalanus amphitrite]XP_043199478.1 uncharacterized protein LOC122369109 [Amphibalanus amphitrite]XP_043205907.1 uncharacterized protein LOC122372590 [Amphibalanus amphitrite]XP_043205908.1 uncharacterized protein LOC122372590 [Amphibalanus amphitrite]
MAAPVGLLASALLLVTGASASVFDADLLASTFALLGERQCLPRDFNSSATQPVAPNCGELVGGSDPPAPCRGVQRLPLFYNCYVNGQGLLDGVADSTSFRSGMKAHNAELSDDQDWLHKTYQIIDDCVEKAADQGLSLPQLAVSSFLCLRWSWFADCDEQRAQSDSMDAVGAQRRVDFFFGQCPLSPSTLAAALETVSGRTLEQCSLNSSPTGNALQMYADTIQNVICLLDNFRNGNNLDISALENAIESSNAQNAADLLDVVEMCRGSKKTEDFVNCWADMGVFSCIFQEANQVASAFPSHCKLSVSQ